MAREPSYPKDAPVAPAKGAEAPPTPPVPEAGESKPADSKRTKHLMAGAAIGIGSAALVAALLYANRSRRDR
jgi:hypothetical protein